MQGWWVAAQIGKGQLAMRQGDFAGARAAGKEAEGVSVGPRLSSLDSAGKSSSQIAQVICLETLPTCMAFARLF